MNNIIIMIPLLIMIGFLGIAIGMYISTQIKCSIRRNIFKNNVEKNEEKKTKQQKSKIYGQKPVKGKRNKREETILHYKTWV